MENLRYLTNNIQKVSVSVRNKNKYVGIKHLFVLTNNKIMFKILNI